ncbi:hypothetical protein CSKR_103118 [Clonorchis sinensis]|uniref:Uncharacterized protein n=1 Tax=Clonorchis sinensis TaxID=79923 RepID=A0A419Q0E7_CLOSI|nr:hypothetical protein CSKR_103118 [Clonorchis sinensis]
MIRQAFLGEFPQGGGSFVCLKCGTDFHNRDTLAMHVMENVQDGICHGVRKTDNLIGVPCLRRNAVDSRSPKPCVASPPNANSETTSESCSTAMSMCADSLIETLSNRLTIPHLLQLHQSLAASRLKTEADIQSRLYRCGAELQAENSRMFGQFLSTTGIRATRKNDANSRTKSKEQQRTSENWTEKGYKSKTNSSTLMEIEETECLPSPLNSDHARVSCVADNEAASDLTIPKPEVITSSQFDSHSKTNDLPNPSSLTSESARSLIGNTLVKRAAVVTLLHTKLPSVNSDSVITRSRSAPTVFTDVENRPQSETERRFNLHTTASNPGKSPHDVNSPKDTFHNADHLRTAMSTKPKFASTPSAACCSISLFKNSSHRTKNRRACMFGSRLQAYPASDITSCSVIPIHSRTSLHARTTEAGHNPQNDQIASGRFSSAHRQSNSRYFCPHCQISFRRQPLFVLHMGLHCVDQPWKCNMCGKLCFGVYDFTAHTLHF